MTALHHREFLPPRPDGSNTVDTFLISDRAAELVDFLVAVLEAEEVPEARTLDHDGLLLHSEVRVGDSVLVVADRKPDWPFTPAFVRVHVHDVDAVLERATQHGAEIVTRPTDFFGDVLARFSDPSGNLWWIQRHDPGADTSAWTDDTATDDTATDESADWSDVASPVLGYIHSTLTEAVRTLRDPRSRAV
ncbi:VOC family protein [Rhodococcus rhodochrous]|uniref:VOC family protein n=1 Tax=Rhodococcus rhodochrous TaxID=1829 RepID=UPI0024BB5B8A|nr:VOC family protein [Rhodococcus rhodochrous]MDJ0397284.1 VOC family protein [Rhodococcus rhodochrous]